MTSWREWKIGTARGENRFWTSDIYTEKTPILDVLNTLLIREIYICFYFTLGKTKKNNQNVIHWTITLITPLIRIVHFKTNYNYRLRNHCFINELILVTYALISNAVEKTECTLVNMTFEALKSVYIPVWVNNYLLYDRNSLLCRRIYLFEKLYIYIYFR